MKHTEHPMGTRPVLPLLVSMSLPAITSMLIQSLYNVVDSIFVARVSNDALTAVSLAYPLQNMVLAVAVGFGVGANAYIARNLGEGNQRNVDRAASMGMVFTTIHAVIFLLIGLLGSEPFLGMFTNDPEILRMSSSYTRIVICLSFGSLYHIYIEKLFQAVGNMFVPMILQGVGAIVNIVLDPILIFGLLGLPALGVTGAAVATVAGQMTACSLAVLYFFRTNPGIHITLPDMRPDRSIAKRIYAVGVPSGLMTAMPAGWHFERAVGGAPCPGGCCVRSIFQTANLCLHAGQRSDSRHAPSNKLQLWCRPPGPHAPHYSMEFNSHRRHHGGRDLVSLASSHADHGPV